MTRYEPTAETVEFAKEAIRVSGLNHAGLSTQADIDRLEKMGERSRFTQKAANAETGRRRGH